MHIWMTRLLGQWPIAVALAAGVLLFTLPDPINVVVFIAVAAVLFARGLWLQRALTSDLADWDDADDADAEPAPTVAVKVSGEELSEVKRLTRQRDGNAAVRDALRAYLDAQRARLTTEADTRRGD